MNKRTSQPPTSPKITKALLDKLSDGILLIDNNDQIVFCNHAATTLTGKENIVGRHLTTLLKLPATNGRPQPHPVLFRLPNTSTDTLAIFFDIRTLPALQRLSKRAKCIVLLQVPSRVENSAASAYQLILGSLTVRIAHDFNNDLSSILGDAEYIQRILEAASSINDEVSTALLAINGIIRRCLESAQTIKQLQAYARQQPRAQDTLDLNETITSVLPIGRKLIGPNINLDFVPTQELPALHADRGELHQVLISLLIASKESMSRGGQITITTKTAYIDDEYVNTHPGSRPGHYLLLTVQDNGAGIQQDPKELFSPTARAQASLELPTAYAIVKHLSGYLDVEPWAGQGTRFEIYLPIYKDESTAPVPPKTKRNRPSNTTRRSIRQAQTQPALILIAEDDAQVRRNMESQLQQAGYRTAVATNGITALETFQELTKNKTKPSLVISDLGLPGIDGKSLCKRIQEKSRRTKILLTSGHLIDMDTQGSKTMDGFNFLRKPFQAAALLTTIEQILNSNNS